MTINLTKMSANGQVVIPSEIRKLAKLKPSAQFLVTNSGNDIVLKHVTKEEVLESIELRKKIERGRKDIKEGRYTKVDSSMSAEEVYALLMS
jgi:AbrB family looped-hinge helix DNA binding protein